jgi:hypothetical protein
MAVGAMLRRLRLKERVDIIGAAALFAQETRG